MLCDQEGGPVPSFDTYLATDSFGSVCCEETGCTLWFSNLEHGKAGDLSVPSAQRLETRAPLCATTLAPRYHVAKQLGQQDCLGPCSARHSPR